MSSRMIVERCDTHGGAKDLSCIYCREALCRMCRHYHINSRPWCANCARQHLPTEKSHVIGSFRFLLELLGLVVVGIVGLLIVPGVVPKVAAMGVLGGLYLYFVLFR